MVCCVQRVGRSSTAVRTDRVSCSSSSVTDRQTVPTAAMNLRSAVRSACCTAVSSPANVHCWCRDSVHCGSLHSLSLVHVCWRPPPTFISLRSLPNCILFNAKLRYSFLSLKFLFICLTTIMHPYGFKLT